RFATALSALNDVPSWKMTSLRSGNVSSVFVEFHFHDVASIGTRPVLSGVVWSRRSYAFVYSCQPLKPPAYVCGLSKAFVPDEMRWVIVPLGSGTCFAAGFAEAGTAIVTNARARTPTPTTNRRHHIRTPPPSSSVPSASPHRHFARDDYTHHE